MKRYDPASIEPFWQTRWRDGKLYEVTERTDKQKYVMLTEFPYPSGDGLHLGHTREYTLGDILARHKRMQGYNVLYPMGYDAFGLPTENYAIKNKIRPQDATDQNVANFQKQFERLGFSIDWSRSFRTSDPDYYRWTQWLFLQFFKHDMAYQADTTINWCPKCKTGLANEEVVNGLHERCDTPVEKKRLKQWMLRITKYAEKLVDNLQTLDFPPRIADQQINWIGRSIGAEVDFAVQNSNEVLRVFTTRPDTLFGATFMVIAPEHELVKTLTTPDQQTAVADYIRTAQSKSDIERQDTNREKTGVFTGSYAINPLTDELIPVWIADYVLMGYGTGAIMAVPAHDDRDHAFASKFHLPIKEVIAPDFGIPLPDTKDVRGPVVVGYDPQTKRYLSLWNTKFDMRWLPGGGLEQGEDFETAALRELKEETGYTNVKKLIQLGGPTYSYYYNSNKDSNRRSFSYMYLAILDENERSQQQLDDDEHYRVDWTSLDDILQDFVGDTTGVEHWIDGLGRAREAVQAYEQGRDYVGPMYTGDGVLFASGAYDGISSAEAREAIVTHLEREGRGKPRVNFRLRDWIFSRQHYWGEPIPIVHCPEHGAVAVPDDQLPVVLPEVDQYEPTDTGESPLAMIDSWVATTCPTCGGPAKRETDTMPNWAGSSWYYLRYFDAHNDQAFADPEKLAYWDMVDLYLGGMEHTTLHLLYSRFWHEFFYDIGLVPTYEPYKARRGQGIILAEDGRKMSKSLGNVVNPLEVVDAGYGADALRTAIAFIAPYDQTTPWDPKGVAGTHRFLNRIWTLVGEYCDGGVAGDGAVPRHLVHKTIKKVSDDLERLSFNTAIAALMEYVNELYKLKVHGMKDPSWEFALATLIKLVAPFAPHVAEQLWTDMGNNYSIHVEDWPVYDEQHVVEDTVTIVIQVNGKVRATLSAAHDASKEDLERMALTNDRVKEYIDGKSPTRIVVIPGRLVNIVV